MSRYFNCEKVVLHPPPHHESRDVGVFSEGPHPLVLGSNHLVGVRITKDSVVATLPLKQQQPDGETRHDLLTEANIASNTDAIMGYASVTKTTDSYAPGLVPEGVAGGSRFLSESGLWGFPSVHTGVVTSSFLSLEDTPNDFTGQDSKYLKVSNSSVTFGDLATDIAGLQLQEVSTGVLHVTSDENAKHCICPMDLEHAVEMLRTIQPVTFQYHGEDRHCLGVLAQEVQRVLPEAVSQGSEYLRVDYIQLVGLLTASQKGILERVDALELRLAGLIENAA